MSTVSIEPAAWETPQFPVRRFTVEEYHRLGELGLLSEDDRIELIEGLLVPKMNRSPLHDVALGMLQKRLTALLPSAWETRSQMAITTADSEPEPDIVVVRGPLDRYRFQHPHPEEIALVVEVSETSLLRDRRKARMCARAGIGCYWIVNLRDNCVEVHTDPRTTVAEPLYGSVIALDGAEACSFSLPGEAAISLAIRDILPTHGERGAFAF